jgi:hypothetical protein
MRREIANPYLDGPPSLRALATTQSILSWRGVMDCFRLRQGFGGQVASLAMTV